jgi:hypothetical protein
MASHLQTCSGSTAQVVTAVAWADPDLSIAPGSRGDELDQSWKDDRLMMDSINTAYLFQCTGEDLYAVSHDATGGNIPRSSCTQGWILCEQFELGPGSPVPAPILPGPILAGISQRGYYIWRGWSSGKDKRPAR